jgi:hypothetical protein
MKKTRGRQSRATVPLREGKDERWAIPEGGVVCVYLKGIII